MSKVNKFVNRSGVNVCSEMSVNPQPTQFKKYRRTELINEIGGKSFIAELNIVNPIVG